MTRRVRIDSLFQHLNVLDTKFGILLSVTTLLLIGFNILLAHLKELLEPWQANRFEPRFSTLFAALGLFVIWLCLSGVRRIVWGDLGEGIADPASATADLIQPAHDRHVRDLIVELAKRTNRFRVAMLATLLQFGLLGIVLVLGIVLLLGPRFMPLQVQPSSVYPPSRLPAWGITEAVITQQITGNFPPASGRCRSDRTACTESIGRPEKR